MKAYITISIILIVNTSFAQRWGLIDDFEKVKIYLHHSSGPDERREEVMVYFSMIEKYIDENYKTPPMVYLGFYSPHIYGDSTIFLISSEKIKKYYHFKMAQGKHSRKELRDNGLIVIIEGLGSLKFDDLIKLVDYGINNLDRIKESQKKHRFLGRTYRYVDSLYLGNILYNYEVKYPDSKAMSEEMHCCRVFKRRGWKVNYYYKNEGYYVYFVEDADSDVLRLNEIVKFDQLTDDQYFIFENDSVFYFLNDENKWVSRHTIKALYEGFPLDSVDFSLRHFTPVEGHLTDQGEAEIKLEYFDLEYVFVKKWRFDSVEKKVKSLGVDIIPKRDYDY